MICATRRLFLAQAALGLTLTGCHSAIQRSRLAVFDAMWKTVDEWYFDPAMNGVDWRAVRREWRPRAAGAETPAALYLDVLTPVLDQLRSSHVDLRPPGDVLELPSGRGFTFPRQKRGLPFFMISPEDEAGMGAVLTWNGSAYVVEDVVVDSPAHAAGLQPGQLVRMTGFRYPKGKRQLNLADRQGRRFTVVWTPGTAPPSTELSVLEGGAACLRFNLFDQQSIDWTIDALGAAGGRLIVLDLRQNSGGRIVDMARLLSVLLPAGSDLGLFRNRKRDYHPVTRPMPTRFNGPLAVLTGPRTASAGEITASVLQHHGRARLFGTPTSASVLESQTFDLPDGGKLNLPVSDYFTPSGTRIEDLGVKPDVAASRTPDSLRDGSDPALDAALTWLRAQQKAPGVSAGGPSIRY